MPDPFQDVDAAGPEFVRKFADTMDVRQSDPSMERIVAAYLERLEIAPGALAVEVGAGAGAVARRIAAHAPEARVIGYEPSTGFVAVARERGAEHANLSFEVAGGADLPLGDGEADAVVMHTVLSHVERPGDLVAEAARVLRPGGRIAICDADFSKSALGSFVNDPLDACAREFARSFVTDRFVVAGLAGLLRGAGLEPGELVLDSRLVTGGQMRTWVEVTTAQMTQRGQIGPQLADGLLAEYDRRAEAGTLYGFQAFGTVVGRKPD